MLLFEFFSLIFEQISVRLTGIIMLIPGFKRLSKLLQSFDSDEKDKKHLLMFELCLRLNLLLPKANDLLNQQSTFEKY
jgi:hypothetical protein